MRYRFAASLPTKFGKTLIEFHQSPGIPHGRVSEFMKRGLSDSMSGPIQHPWKDGVFKPSQGRIGADTPYINIVPFRSETISRLKNVFFAEISEVGNATHNGEPIVWVQRPGHRRSHSTFAAANLKRWFRSFRSHSAAQLHARRPLHPRNRPRRRFGLP